MRRDRGGIKFNDTRVREEYIFIRVRNDMRGIQKGYASLDSNLDSFSEENHNDLKKAGLL